MGMLLHLRLTCPGLHASEGCRCQAASGPRHSGAPRPARHARSLRVHVGGDALPQEVIRDLLASDAPAGAQPAVNIREVAGGGVCLAGAREQEVRPMPALAR